LRLDLPWQAKYPEEEIAMMGQSNPASLMHRIVALALLLICVVYLHAATGFSFGSWSSPKAGFTPTIVGVLGVLLATANVVRVFRTGFSEPVDFGVSPRRALAFLVILLLYAGLLGVVGFLPATFLATLVFLKIGELRGFVLPIVIAAVFAGSIWFLFGHILQLPLP
jgi:hypothetical protein